MLLPLFILVLFLISNVDGFMGINRISSITRQHNLNKINTNTELYGLGDMFKGAFENQNLPPPTNPGLSKEAQPVTVKFLPSGKECQAYPGQKLSLVANAARVKIKYNCQEGDCGTCEVKFNGKVVKTCVSSLPATPSKKGYVIEVFK